MLQRVLMIGMAIGAIVPHMSTAISSKGIRCPSKHQGYIPDTSASIQTSASHFGSSNGSVPIQILYRLGEVAFYRHLLQSGEANWDIQRLVKDLQGALLNCATYGQEGRFQIHEAIFGTRQRTFLHYYDGGLRIYAHSQGKIRSVARRLARYLISYPKAKPEFGTYHLLRMGGCGIETHPVRMKPSFQKDATALKLQYGSGFNEWHGRFHSGLLDRDHGLTIFDGPPGTGKTSYLRHLMVQLRETHRFYFVPPSSVGIVSSPGFVDFWNSEREEAGDKRFVMVLEDAEQALMSRGGDNRNEVSSILNITDGLLADFLQIQLICTINCDTNDIDSALLRPGRLFAQRTFRRLPYREAHLLASSLGNELPLMRDYSLAEIFAVDPITEEERIIPKIGFAA